MTRGLESSLDDCGRMQIQGRRYEKATHQIRHVSVHQTVGYRGINGTLLYSSIISGVECGDTVMSRAQRKVISPESGSPLSPSPP